MTGDTPGGNVTPFRKPAARKPSPSRVECCRHGVPVTLDCMACHGVDDLGSTDGAGPTETP
jgi:hypothetical protein